MRHGSLFSGIGGFDLAASWMGWDNAFHCEKDPFCRKVLQYYWPEAVSYEDVCRFDATQYRGTVDIISGGFPCQPFSTAGRRKGTEDDRYLWPQARRIIEQVRPRWIVLENVAGLFTILEPEGLSEVEIKAVELFCADKAQPQTSAIVRLQKRVIGSIISEIGAAGYVLPQLTDGTPVVLCIPACAVNAPHRRDRVWFVAHADGAADRQYCDQPRRRDDQPADEQAGQKAAAVAEGRADRAYPAMGPDPYADSDGQQRCDRPDEVDTRKAGIYGRGNAQSADRYAADPGSQGLEGTEGQGVQRKGGQSSRFAAIPGWDEWPAQPAVCGGNDGIPRELDGITFSKWRTESVKAYGNAIVPQIALELFKVIGQLEKVFNH